MSMKTSKSPDLGTSNDAQIYSLLSTSDEDHDSKTVAPASDSDGYFYQSKPKNYKFESKQVAIRHRLADVVIAIIATIVIVCVFRYLTFNSETLRDNAIASLYSNRARLTPLYHCGNSSSEARSLGCIFDLSLVGWVPGPCFDPILNQRFMDYGWRFFEDQNGTTEVSLDHIAKSAGTREPFWAQHGGLDRGG
ncbi:hypothetical protein H2198_001920 [Neophaeococcomyces mojaviensis]|uniref:Uncharacterized protein n=1 Tax=Neophaeococcomyces mojaviensis TaxID=3383035 RepID=A0ACC3AFR5_9EURO|nr:hypothetical protein H2198_001920 [Knufia sp. JES_112]